MIAPTEFIVNGFVEGFAGELRIMGRCGDASIRLGDVFDKLRDQVDGMKAVSLEVVAIQAYGRSLTELGMGMTGTIDVRGEGVQLLRPSSVLVAGTSNQNSSDDAALASAVEHVG